MKQKSYVKLANKEIVDDSIEIFSPQEAKKEAKLFISGNKTIKLLNLQEGEEPSAAMEYWSQQKSTEALSHPPRNTGINNIASQHDKPLIVEERLLKLGEASTERRLRRNKEKDLKRKEEEDAIVEKIGSLKLCNSRVPVEDRLQEYAQFNLDNRVERERELKKTQEENYQQLQVNERSKEIVKESKWVPRVEDRLIYCGQKAKLIREEHQKIIDRQRREQATPHILMSSRILCASENRQNSQERLLSTKKIQREPIESERKFTFTPNISQKTRRLAQKQHHQSRSVVKLNSSHPEFSFHPEISKNSVKLLNSTKKEKTFHRTRTVNRSECSFVPKLNPESVEIDKKRIKGDRCEYLYNLTERLRENLATEQKIAEQKKIEQEYCSFKPQIISTYKSDTLRGDELSNNFQWNTVRDQTLGVQSRTYLWDEFRKNKLETLIQTEQEKEINQCSFKPEIVRSRPKSIHRSRLVHQSAKKSSGSYSRQNDLRSEDRHKESSRIAEGTNLLSAIQSLHHDLFFT